MHDSEIGAKDELAALQPETVILPREEPNENSVAKAEKSATFDPATSKPHAEVSSIDKQDSFDMAMHMEQARIQFMKEESLMNPSLLGKDPSVSKLPGLINYFCGRSGVSSNPPHLLALAFVG